jgi:uroporphyrinogen-III synthase
MNDAEKIALPLAGRRVLVTRARHQAGKLSEGLRALGAEPVEVPVIEIQPPSDFAPLDRALRELATPNIGHLEQSRRGDRVEGPASLSISENDASHDPGRQPPYDWLILTSANTVRALADRAQTLNLDLTAPGGLRVAAIGEATAEAARHAGLAVTLVPESYVAESLVAEILRASQSEDSHALKGHGFSRATNMPKSAGALAPEGLFRGQRILIARAAIARDVIPHALRAAGATVDVVDAYRNVLPASAPALLREALKEGIDAAAFTSSSSVTHLADAAQKAGIAFPFAGVAAISIGPITGKTLRDLGWEPAAEGNPSDVPGLIQAIARVLSWLR